LLNSLYKAKNIAGENRMISNPSIPANDSFSFSAAANFWEPRRLFYNLILSAIAIVWIVATWPHFRPALTVLSLEQLAVLVLLANLCYCAAYFADFPIQHLLPDSLWRRSRWAIWVLGALFAILLENYWIADEIYPDVPATTLASRNVTPHIASNMNFPAPVAIMCFLAACGGLFLAVAAVFIAWFARKPRFARAVLRLTAVGTAIYFALLFGFSLASRAHTLARGEEKYFCEIDCHLAYSVTDIQAQSEVASTRYTVTIRTHFDETTTSSHRPKDEPLTPSPRLAYLIDDTGHQYSSVSIAGTPLLTPLKPADSYTTSLVFEVPSTGTGLRLLINTEPSWPDHFIIGDENSWLHKKTYFAL
jgi:hypothetical protein